MFSTILICYFAVALSTGLCNYVLNYRPILKEVKRKELFQNSIEMRYPLLAASIIIIITTVLAPFALRKVLMGFDKESIAKFIDHLDEDY